MEPTAPEQITVLLHRMREGDSEARTRLITLVYPHLKRIAARRLRGERSDHTLQPTALVHEVLVRLIGSEEVFFRDRVHFFALSANLMRRILVDAARRRRAVKRGSGVARFELNDWDGQFYEQPDLILEIDRLLKRLEALDRRQAQVVELRYFAGLAGSEIADVLGVSERTVKRDWNMARAWMRKELRTP
jgi:RNA polymerase sigma-70 factor (ECF subfamily)